MDIHVDDDGFVRAPAAACYRALTHVEAWPEFWPDTSVRAVAENAFEVRIGSARRRLDLRVEAHSWRHDEGVRLRLDGDLHGDAEFWLEGGWHGTVVHHLATAHITRRRPRPATMDYRRWLRGGLWGLKDMLQAPVPAS